jgi:hypothetical protein
VILLWDAKKGEVVAQLSKGGDGPAVGLVFLDKGKALIGAPGGSSLERWDLSGL